MVNELRRLNDLIEDHFTSDERVVAEINERLAQLAEAQVVLTREFAVHMERYRGDQARWHERWDADLGGGSARVPTLRESGPYALVAAGAAAVVSVIAQLAPALLRLFTELSRGHP